MSDYKINHDDDIIKTDDGLIFNPFNPYNVEITLSEVQSILEKYGIPPKVHNMNLYKRAFVHRSYTKRPNFENIQPNFFKLVLIFFSSALREMINHLCRPISYAIFPIASFLTIAIFFSVMNPSFSFGKRRYNKYLVTHSKIPSPKNS